jgi:hypothetical protein
MKRIVSNRPLPSGCCLKMAGTVLGDAPRCAGPAGGPPLHGRGEGRATGVSPSGRGWQPT